MPKITTFRCGNPGCGSYQAQANGWWLVGSERDPAGFFPKIWIRPLHGEIMDFEDCYCGRSCAMRRIECWFDEIHKGENHVDIDPKIPGPEAAGIGRHR